MLSALDVHHLLLNRGVDHELVRTKTHAVSADDLPRALGVAGQCCIAVRCFAVQGCRTADGSAVHLVAVLVRAGDVPDRDSLQATLDASAVRAATADEINAHTGFSAAFVSPVGLPEDVVVLADTALMSSDQLYAATGEVALALRIGTHDLLVATGARVAQLTSHPLETAGSAPWGASPGTLAQQADRDPELVIDLTAPRPSSRRFVG